MRRNRMTIGEQLMFPEGYPDDFAGDVAATERVKQEARRIAFATRTDRWKALDAITDQGGPEAEEALIEMADIVDQVTAAELAKLPAAMREAVAVEVNLFFARLTGVVV